MDSTDAELAINAAEAACDVLRAKYGTALSRHYKSGTDFATDADIEAETAILQIIRAARPTDGFIGEELGATGTGAPDGRAWLVDPLCGTLNYAAQTPLVAVNVALRTSAGVTVAAAADPFAQELFWTAGEHAYRRYQGADERLRPSSQSALVDLNLDAAPGQGHRTTTARMLSVAAFAAVFRPRVLSTTLALSWVAAGRRAAYVTDGDLIDSVHFASGIALCQAAGCVVTGVRGQPLHTGIGGLVAAADHQTHAALMEIIDGLPAN